MTLQLLQVWMGGSQLQAIIMTLQFNTILFEHLFFNYLCSHTIVSSFILTLFLLLLMQYAIAALLFKFKLKVSLSIKNAHICSSVLNISLLNMTIFFFCIKHLLGRIFESNTLLLFINWGEGGGGITGKNSAILGLKNHQVYFQNKTMDTIKNQVAQIKLAI